MTKQLMQPDLSKNSPNTEAFDNQRLRQNIDQLATMLGETIKEHAGQEIFEAVEALRHQTKTWRAVESGTDVNDIVNFCNNLTLDETSPVLKAFTTYFHLINLAEENHRIRVLRERERGQTDKPLNDSIAEAIHSIKTNQATFTAEQMQQTLNNLLVDLVFTAHPTESKRRTVLEKLRHMNELLLQLDYDHLLPRERTAILNDLRANVDLLWLTDQVRSRKPTVIDEVKNGLWYFSENLFDMIPKLYQSLKQALKESYPEHQFDIPTVLQFGSWMGGDRDGNPFVTAAVTRETLHIHQKLARQYFNQRVQKLMHQLTVTADRETLPANLKQFLDEQAEQHPDLARALDARRQRESYRQILSYINHHLSHPPTISLDGINYEIQSVYNSGQDLLSDLNLVAQGLHDISPYLVEQQIEPLLRQAQTFGLHAARLDIRQHSGVHENVVTELLKQAQIMSDYAALSEAEKVDTLTRLLATTASDASHITIETVDPTHLSPETAELLALFRLLKRTIRQNPAAIGCYLISMAHEPSDVLEILWFAKLVGLYQPEQNQSDLDIAPLLETVSDLKNSKSFLEGLMAVEAYRKHLELRNNRQTVQLGYSDGTKDGGYLTANWMLYQAQNSMAEFAAAYQVDLTFFHGRGGSVGRGGGPTNRVIRGLPSGSMQGKIRLTEQGEMIFDRFAYPAIALRYLEQVIGAALQVGARQTDTIDSKWTDMMAGLSQTAFDTYRHFVYQTPGFIEYFRQATPIDIVTELTIGSRPARRKSSDAAKMTMSAEIKDPLEDLRAIPWVFAWMQSRHAIPGWFGLGSALQHHQTEHGLESLQAMYEAWPFFQAVISNAQMALAKADMNIAACYADLVSDANLRERVFGKIQAEYNRTEKAILAIVGEEKLLNDEPVLQRAIQLRNPYVDPLNFIQVSLLRRWRDLPQDSPERQKILDGLRLSIVGVAAGLKNMG